MYVKLDGDEVRDVKLRIYEPPRFFEAFLRGRAFTEVPDITARICGICPIAYQMSSVRAMEDACGVSIDSGPIRDLRRLIYCGEWIESHSLHVYLLHAPDFLGYPGFVEMARDHPDIAEQGLRMKKAGNALMTIVGGREVHPINVRVGGFYRAPTRSELRAAGRSARARARDGAAHRAVGRRAAVSGLRRTSPSWSRSRTPTPIRSISGASSPIARPRHRAGRVRRAHRRGARRALQRAARADPRARCYLTGPLARYNLWLRAPAAARPRRRRATPGSARRAATPSRASSSARSSSSRPATRRWPSSAPTSRPSAPSVRCSRGARSDTAPPRRRGACSTTATRSTRTGRSSTRHDRPPTSQNQLAIEEDLRAVVAQHARAAR